MFQLVNQIELFIKIFPMKKDVALRTADMFVRDPLYEEKAPAGFRKIDLKKLNVKELFNESFFTKDLSQLCQLVYNLKIACT